MKKIAVLISGNGTTLQALIEACTNGKINAKIDCVISNKADAYGLVRAQLASIPTQVFLRKDFADNQAMDHAIADFLEAAKVDLIVLAGYMKILTEPFITRFAGKIINIHPSLLPKYPGLHTYQKALDNGDKEQGTTVHFVNQDVDAGAIILQAKVPVFADDTVVEIEQRVKEQEVQIYPLVVQWFVDGRLHLVNDKAELDGKILPPQGYASE